MDGKVQKRRRGPYGKRKYLALPADEDLTLDPVTLTIPHEVVETVPYEVAEILPPDDDAPLPAPQNNLTLTSLPEHLTLSTQTQGIAATDRISSPSSEEISSNAFIDDNEIKTERTVKLLEESDILVPRSSLKSAIDRANTSSQPGYALVLKLMPLVFSRPEMASSRCQGLAPVAKDDIRPPLNKHKCEVVKEYAKAWCRKHNFDVPTYRKLNKAITEAVGYSRKVVKSKIT